MLPRTSRNGIIGKFTVSKRQGQPNLRKADFREDSLCILLPMDMRIRNLLVLFALIHEAQRDMS